MNKRLIGAIILLCMLSGLVVQGGSSDLVEDRNPAPSQIPGYPETRTRIIGNQTDPITEYVATDMVIGSMGDSYVTGCTISSIIGLASSELGYYDAYVSHLFANSTIDWTYFLPGKNGDCSHSIALDSENNVIVEGITGSDDFPVVPGPGDFDGDIDLFVTKLSSSGEIIFSRVFGSDLNDLNSAIDVQVDLDDNIIISTECGWGCTNFYVTDESESVGMTDLILVKLSASGEILFSTIFGGMLSEGFSGGSYHVDRAKINSGIDSKGNIYLFSSTESIEFPGNIGPSSHLESSSTILVKFASNGTLLWSKYLEGDWEDYAHAIEVMKDDSVLVVGKTWSKDFPILGAFDTTADVSEGFITRFSADGEILWSSYFGGNNEDWLNDIAIDNDGNIYITGISKSNDLPETGDSEPQGLQDIVVSKLSPSGDPLWTRYLGGSDTDKGLKVEVYDDEVRVLGVSQSDEFSSLNGYDYRLNEEDEITAFMAILDADGQVQQVSLTLTLLNAYEDQDGDGVPTIGEYSSGSNPFSNDSDGDGMDDAWEIKYHLQPMRDDSNEDADEDGIINFTEYRFKSDPRNPDTDGDGMPDGWEYENELDLLTADADKDAEGDGMTNIYEYENGLNPRYNDSAEDKDGDTLRNIEEYYLNTSAINPDTDGDGMDDGWEVAYGLDPNNPADAVMDLDGDMLSNRFEYRYSFMDPSSPREGQILIMLLVLLTGAIILLIRQIVRRNNLAKSVGYQSYRHQKETEKLGFGSIDERKQAEEKGYFHSLAMNIMQAAGYLSVDQFTSKYFTQKEIIETKLREIDAEGQVELIRAIDTPEKMVKDKEVFMGLISDLEFLLTQIEAQHSLLLVLRSVYTDTGLVTTSLEQQVIDEMISELSSQEKETKKTRKSIADAIEVQNKWLQPWDAFLSFLQVTRDGLPISLDQISEITSIPENHAEKLVIALLQNYPAIGSYDMNRREYTKGLDVQQYIDMVFKSIDGLKK